MILSTNTALQKVTTATTDEPVIAMWLAQKSLSTQQTYFYVVKQFRKVVDKPLSKVQFDDLLHWINSLNSQSQNTRRNKVAVIKSLFRFAHKIGYLTLNPAQLLKQPKENDCRVERILTKSQIQAISNNMQSFRNEMILKTLYVLGLRVTELINLCWHDFIHTDNGIKLKIIGKGSQVRYLIVPASLYRSLETLKRHSESQFVFSSRKSNNGGQLSRVQVYRIVRQAGEQQYIKASPHYLRHSHATHSLSNGCDLNLLSTSLGHGNIAITSRYLHASENDGSANYISI